MFPPGKIGSLALAVCGFWFCPRSSTLAVECWGVSCGSWCLDTGDRAICGQKAYLCCLRSWRIEVKTENTSFSLLYLLYEKI